MTPRRLAASAGTSVTSLQPSALNVGTPSHIAVGLLAHRRGALFGSMVMAAREDVDMRYENQTLTGLTIRLDEDEIVGCQLVDCQILFGGIRPPIYSGNRAIGCQFQFADSALVTIDLMRRMLEVPSLREVVLAELGLLSGQGQRLH
jgi:hypothetical protein